jgi:hypothetical protein
MKIFLDPSRKCFASARVVASARLRNTTHTRKISFSGLVIQITIVIVLKLINDWHKAASCNVGTF